MCSTRHKHLLKYSATGQDSFKSLSALLYLSFANVTKNKMLTHASPSSHRSPLPHQHREEGSGKGRPPVRERHVSDPPVWDHRAWNGKLEEDEEKPSFPPH